MDALLEQIIADFHERPLPQLTRRTVELPALTNKIDTVIGMRRTGKTWFLYQQMQDCMERGIPKECLLYINFDDERLYPMQRDELRRIPETYYRLYPLHKQNTCYFFFDEIQNVDGWEPFVRRLLDSENIQLALTGSSARLLSREIASTLRGRAITTEIFPFSFAEVLTHQGIDHDLFRPPGAEKRALYANRLHQYLLQGGFPEIQGVEAPYRQQILQEYVDVVILRDVIERHGVTNIVPLRYLIRHLLNAPATLFSVNRFHNDLKSQGIAIGKNTLHEYLEYLIDAYLIDTVPIFARSVRRRQVNPRKVYAIDTGLAQAFRHDAHVDRGRLLENMVFTALRRQRLEISYFRSEEGYEVDFHTTSRDGIRQLIQVSETLSNSQTRQRELRALVVAMEQCQLNTATVVTVDEAERIEQHGRLIEVIPAWRWLLTQT
ncbi:ATPase [Candidatus Tenderia electrophaga]|jgi:hypothetical protein|uniref:ATPase n=1 Tax=Candidatus Tenderia electrophaga TaxID=1748243 RepID=A0A0S2TDJ0_9GAMM|nr:ATPase [Candidatus Tenderia electrophaga]